MKRGYADTPEGQVHYLTEGSGKPLLLIHMTPLSSLMFRRLIPVLARTRRVIAMDTLGFGGSDPPPASYTQIRHYAANVAHFLDALEIERADIVGALTGSVIASEVAIQFPQRVDRLVLFPFVMWISEAERAQRIAETCRAAAITSRPDGSHVRDVLKHAYGRQVDADHPVEDFDAEYMDGWIVDAVRAGRGISEIALKVYAHDSAGRLPLVKAPTLVIGLGGKIMQTFNTPDRVRRIHQLIPDSEYVVMNWPDADFRVWYTRREEIAGIVLPFLDRATRAP